MITEIDFLNKTETEIDPSMHEKIEEAIIKSMTHFEVDRGFAVDVSFVEPEEIRALNRYYRDTDLVTDVLSFPMEDVDARGVTILGDIVICLERATEQASEYGHSLTREVCYLAVHSVLHLCGMDHEEDGERSEMRMLEKRIMDELGIYKQEKRDDK
jgi:probable rRNA maturation factor